MAQLSSSDEGFYSHLNLVVHRIIQQTQQNNSAESLEPDFISNFLNLCEKYIRDCDRGNISPSISQSFAKCALSLLTLKSSSLDGRILNFLCQLYDVGGLNDLIFSVRDILTGDTTRASDIYSKLLDIPNPKLLSDLLDATLDNFLMSIFEQAPESIPHLRTLLDRLVLSHGTIFYRHIFECVWANKTSKIIHCLNIMTMLTHYMGIETYFFTDVDMMVSAILTEPGNNITLGRAAIILEVIFQIRKLRKTDADLIYPNLESSSSLKSKMSKLEYRMSLFIKANEIKNPYPLLLRQLIINLFHTIRRFTRSIKRPPWLSQVIDWVTNYDDINDISSNLLYTAEWIKCRQNLSSIYMNMLKTNSIYCEKSRVASRPQSLFKFSEHYLCSAFNLLAMLFPVLEPKDLKLLGEAAWVRFPLDDVTSAYKPIGFVLAVSSDSLPQLIQNRIVADIYSPIVTRRAAAIDRLAAFFGIRSEVQTQEYLSSSDRRLPFRNQAAIIPFVPTDIGSPQDTELRLKQDMSLNYSAMLPVEIRKQLMKLGWDESDPSGFEDVLREQMSVSALSMTYFGGALLDKDFTNEGNMSKKKAKQLRRRPVYIPVFGIGNLGLIDLLNDSHGALYNLSREVTSYFLREDPGAFMRIFLTNLRLRDQKHYESLTRIRLLVSKHAKFPLSFTYQLFNDLLGYIKWSSKEQKGTPIYSLYLTLPLLADLTGMVSEMTLRDIRKSKVDMFLFPSSTLSTLNVTKGDDVATFTEDEKLQRICIKISQNVLVKNFVSTYSKEVTPLRKLLLEGMVEKCFLIDAPEIGSLESTFHLCRVQAWLSATYAIFEATPRSFNDRDQLKLFLHQVDHVTSVYDIHDSSTFSLVLRLYSLITRKFKKLFNVGRSFNLIVPNLFRIYTRVSPHFQNRSNENVVGLAILYLWHQFYSAYGDTFLLQAFSSLAPIVSRESERGEVAKTLFEWLFALEELKPECAIAAESISLGNFEVLNNNGRGENTTNGFGETQQYENQTREEMADILRLFITIIAYDPVSLRAEQFVKILRLLIPDLVKILSIENVLSDGIIALLRILSQWSRYAKSSSNEGGMESTTISNVLNPNNKAKLSETYGKNWIQNDKITIRVEFLKVVQIYEESGGKDLSYSHRPVAVLVRHLLKDLIGTSSYRYVGMSIGRYIMSCIMSKRRSATETQKQLNFFLNEISTSVRQCGRNVDFTDMNLAIASVLLENSEEINEELINTICSKIVSPQMELLCSRSVDGGISEESDMKLGMSIVEICKALWLTCNMDIVYIFSKQISCPRFLSYIIIPFAREIPSQTLTNSRNFTIELEAERWTSFIGWLLFSCQKNFTFLMSHDNSRGSSNSRKVSRGKNSRTTEDGGNQNELSTAGLRGTTHGTLTFALYLTAVKFVLVRSERYLTLYPGLWFNVSFALKNLVMERKKSQATQGNAFKIFSFASERLETFLCQGRTPVSLHIPRRPFKHSRIEGGNSKQTLDGRSSSLPNGRYWIRSIKNTARDNSSQDFSNQYGRTLRKVPSHVSFEYSPVSQPLLNLSGNSLNDVSSIKNILDSLENEFNHLYDMMIRLLI